MQANSGSGSFLCAIAKASRSDGLSVKVFNIKLAMCELSHFHILCDVFWVCLYCLLCYILYRVSWLVCVLTVFVLFAIISFVKGGKDCQKRSSIQCSVMVENGMVLFSSTWRLRASATTFVAPDSNCTCTSYKDIVCSILPFCYL